MLLRQPLKTRTDAMELSTSFRIASKDLGTPLFRKNLKVWEDFRWTGLGQKT
jgi:hypothetical protein